MADNQAFANVFPQVSAEDLRVFYRKRCTEARHIWLARRRFLSCRISPGLSIAFELPSPMSIFIKHSGDMLVCWKEETLQPEVVSELRQMTSPSGHIL